MTMRTRTGCHWQVALSLLLSARSLLLSDKLWAWVQVVKPSHALLPEKVCQRVETGERHTEQHHQYYAAWMFAH